MSAVRMRVRAELRARWRAWLLLALAFGFAGGATMASAAGARRTESAYPRFLEAYDSFHLITGGMEEVDDPAEVRRRLSALPQVEAAGGGQFVTMAFKLPTGELITFPEALVLGDPSGVELLEFNRARVIEGRMFDPAAPGDAVVDLIAADRYNLHPGDRLTIMLFDPETFQATVPAEVTITGVIMAPGGLPAVGQVPLTGVQVSPAFIREHQRFIPPNEDGPSIRLKGGVEQIPEYMAAARKINPGLDFPVELPRHVEGVRRTLRFDVGALWILALLIGGASFVLLGQAVARHIQLEAGANDSFRAVGFGRSQLIAADLLRAGAVGAAAAAIALGVGLGLSPLTPRGLARSVEPAPGVLADWTVLGIGTAVTLLTPLLVSLVPAMRSARRRLEPVSRPSRLAAWLTASGAGPGAVVGTRLALEPGRGSRAVPVRATIGGIALALAAFTAAGTFTGSLDALIDSPELYGFGWDVFAGSEDTDGDVAYFEADPDVETFSRGGYTNAEIDGRQLIPLVFEPGRIEPTILEGRAPAADDEIALGTALVRELGRDIGDAIEVRPEQRRPGPAVTFRVVGRVVVPPIFFLQVEPGETAALTLDGMARLDPREDPSDAPLLIKYRTGVDVSAKIAALRADRPGVFVGQVREPGAELAALSRSSSLPVVLTFVLLGMAVATLIHTLGSSIRKRRRDLAILKTLGFSRGQVRGAVAWQASTLAGLAVLIGIPVGIAAGRQAWRWFANTLGVVPDPVSPWLVAAVLVPVATIALANLIAALPARAAARTQPALVLRSE